MGIMEKKMNYYISRVKGLRAPTYLNGRLLGRVIEPSPRIKTFHNPHSGDFQIPGAPNLSPRIPTSPIFVVFIFFSTTPT